MDGYIDTIKKEMNELHNYCSAYWTLYGWVSAIIKEQDCPENIKNSLNHSLEETIDFLI